MPSSRADAVGILNEQGVKGTFFFSKQLFRPGLTRTYPNPRRKELCMHLPTGTGRRDPIRPPKRPPTGFTFMEPQTNDRLILGPKYAPSTMASEREITLSSA
jgi:hypothetical protein